MTEPSSATSAADRLPKPRHGLFDRWFRRVGAPLEAGRDLTALTQRGSVVFVMRSAGVLNFLYLAWYMRQLGLPVLRTALGLTGIMPWLARVRWSPMALKDAIGRGKTSIVFLKRASGPDPFQLLVALQRHTNRPIFLVPALLVWTRRPQKLKPSLGDLLFGTPDIPSRLANAIGFVLNHRRAVLRLGHASDLTELIAERASEPEAILGRKLRGALHLHLARQMRTVVGPPLKAAARLRDQVLRDRSLRATLQRTARESGKSMSDLQREAERDLQEIASRYSPAFIEFLRPIIAWILHRLYDAVDVDEEGLARVKRAAADAPIVLCPSHKSHIDYLVLSLLFYDHGMTPPHIAAGINLAFWPFGAIARRGGAFFIRRSLRGNRIYTATLRAYIKQLLRDRYPQEFYLEGGRSRSGKLLSPKTGLFSMEVDAWLEEAASDVLFVPVAIDYEVLIEGSSYARELAGGEKTKENVSGLLRASKVLGRRYGRLTVQFEEPISLSAFARQRLGDGGQPLAPDDEGGPAGPEGAEGMASLSSKRQLVQALANRVAYGISRASTVTPVGLVATALLSNLRRGLTAEELARRVQLLRSIAAASDARFAHGLAGASPDPLVAGPIADAVARLVDEGLIRVERAAGETIYLPVEERRPLLDYHKNAVIQRYVALALVAVGLQSSGGDAALDDVKEATRWLSRLLKLEFMYRVGASFDEIFAENVAILERLGLVREEGARLRAGADAATLDFVSNLLRPYLEAYRLTFEALLVADGANPAAGIERRALGKAALEHGRAAYAAGRIALRESLSKATFENAVDWIFQQGALVPVEGGRARLAASWRDKRLPEVIAQIDAALQT